MKTDSIFKPSNFRKTRTTDSYSLAHCEIGELAEVFWLILYPKKSYSIDANNESIILLPLIGSCEVSKDKIAREVSYDEVMVLNHSHPISVKNLLEESIKLMVIKLDSSISLPIQNKMTLRSIIFSKKNHWASIDGVDFVKIGVFSSQYEDELIYKQSNAFISVMLKGNIEIDGKILFEEDVLYLKKNKIEFEVLAEDSILFTIFFKS